MQVMLPYRTDWRAVMSMLDYVKGKGADRPALEARLGAGEGFRETLNTAEQLGLVEREDSGEIRLTLSGQQIAYASNDAEGRRELALALCRYAPYRVPFERAVQESLRVIDGPSVEHTWQVNMRLGQPRNRVEEARTFFFRLADEAGLGSFRRGVRGQPTRLELVDGFASMMSAMLRETDGEPEEVEAPDTSMGEQRTSDVQSPSMTLTPSAGPAGVNLEIHVDMTEWDLDRIEAFLDMVGLRVRSEQE